MIQYASVNKLEQKVEEGQYAYNSYGAAFEKLAAESGIKLLPLSELEQQIAVASEEYRSKEYKSNFQLKEIPSSWQYLAGLLIPAQRIQEWFYDCTRYPQDERCAPVDKLSVLEPALLRKEIGVLVDTFTTGLGFVSAPDLPSKEQLYYLTRLAQYDQLTNQIIISMDIFEVLPLIKNKEWRK